MKKWKRCVWIMYEISFKFDIVLLPQDMMDVDCWRAFTPSIAFVFCIGTTNLWNESLRYCSDQVDSVLRGFATTKLCVCVDTFSTIAEVGVNEEQGWTNWTEHFELERRWCTNMVRDIPPPDLTSYPLETRGRDASRSCLCPVALWCLP